MHTAYYLARANKKDRLPDNLSTKHDYGFSKAFCEEDQSKLLALYKILLCLLV